MKAKTDSNAHVKDELAAWKLKRYFLCLRSELEVRLEHALKDLSQMEERIKFLRAEKSEQFEMVDELQIELGNCHFPEWTRWFWPS